MKLIKILISFFCPILTQMYFLLTWFHFTPFPEKVYWTSTKGNFEVDYKFMLSHSISSFVLFFTICVAVLIATLVGGVIESEVIYIVCGVCYLMLVYADIKEVIEDTKYYIIIDSQIIEIND